MLIRPFKTALMAVLAMAALLFATAPSHAQSYGSGYGEYSRSKLQSCYYPYSVPAHNGIKQYTGYCYASFDRHGNPLYRYHQYRVCEQKGGSKGVFSYYKKTCGARRYERRRHPHRDERRYDRHERHHEPRPEHYDWGKYFNH